MSLQIDYDDLKLQALEEAISYPHFKEEKDAPFIDVDEFKFNLINDKIKINSQLFNTEGAHMEMILEMAKLLDEHRKRFKIELHNNIGFYWRGLPILIVKVKNENLSKEQNRIMYISVKVYKDDLKEKIMEKKMNRGVAMGIIGILVFGAAFAGFAFFKRKIEK